LHLLLDEGKSACRQVFVTRGIASFPRLAATAQPQLT
jgi:hypothetical protein